MKLALYGLLVMFGILSMVEVDLVEVDEEVVLGKDLGRVYLWKLQNLAFKQHFKFF
jgi:hypothetical protein